MFSRCQLVVFWVAVFCALVEPLRAQTTYNWAAKSSSWAADGWNTGLPTTGGETLSYPGYSPANAIAGGSPNKGSDIADAGVVGSYKLGFNFDAPPSSSNNDLGSTLTLGAFLYNPTTAATSTMITADQVTQNGTLIFTGDTVNNVPNVILSNTAAGTGSWTIEPTTSSGTMSIQLASGNNAILCGAGSSASKSGNTLSITTLISDGSSASNIVFLGNGTTAAAPGILDLNGTSSFTGGITVGDNSGSEAGEVEIDSSAAFPTSGSISVTPGSELLLYATANATNSYGSASQSMTLNGVGTAKNSGALRVDSSGSNVLNATWLGTTVLGSNTIITPTSVDTLTLSNTITDNGYLLEKQGGGTLILGGNNATSLTGSTQVGNGLVVVNAGSNIAPGPLTMASTSTNPTAITFNNAAQTIGNLSSSFIATTGTIAQVVTLNGTALTINETGSGSAYGVGSVSTLSSIIAGSGSLTLSASSTAALKLSSTNTYTGTTTVNGGTLQILASGAITGTGAITVNGGGFGGGGSVAGPATIYGGTLFEGGANTAIGNFSTSSSLTLTSNATMKVKLQNPTGPGGTVTEGTDGDVLVLVGSGGVFTPGNATMQVLTVATAGNNFANTTFPVTYEIVDATGGSGNSIAPNSTFAGLAENVQYTDSAGDTYSVDYQGNQIDLTLYAASPSAVPEPASMGLLALLGAGLMRRVPRSRKAKG